MLPDYIHRPNARINHFKFRHERIKNWFLKNISANMICMVSNVWVYLLQCFQIKHDIILLQHTIFRNPETNKELHYAWLCVGGPSRGRALTHKLPQAQDRGHSDHHLKCGCDSDNWPTSTGKKHRVIDSAWCILDQSLLLQFNYAPIAWDQNSLLLYLIASPISILWGFGRGGGH